MKSRGEALCFDDILLVPQHSAVMSRKDVDLTMRLGDSKLKLPIISSPMDTITEGDMALAMRCNYGLGIIHRYMSIEAQVAEAKKVNSHLVKFGAAVGATGDYIERAAELTFHGASVILVDVAFGESDVAIQAVKKLKAEFPDVHIMAGNVSTWDGYFKLALAGASSVRVGIGGGSCCTTRLVSGHGVPTLASIMEIAHNRLDPILSFTNFPSIVADGGMRTPGDIVKAFAAGADVVMLGSMLAGTDETPGEVKNGRKEFRGMASAAAQESRERNDVVRERNGSSRTEAHGQVEGISTTVPASGPVSRKLQEIAGGIRSGCSYSGVSRLKDLADRAEYVRVTGASLGESRPHAI